MKNAVSECSSDISNLFMMLTTNFGPQQTKNTTIIVSSILITCKPIVQNGYKLQKVKDKEGYKQFVNSSFYRYGKSHIIWDHTVLPATRQG